MTPTRPEPRRPFSATGTTADCPLDLNLAATSDLDRALARARAHAHAEELALARDRARDVALELTNAHNLTRCLELELTRARADDLARALTSDLIDSRELATARKYALDLAHTLATDRRLDLLDASDLAYALAQALERAHSRALASAHKLSFDDTAVGDIGRVQTDQLQLARLPIKLTGLAVTLLAPRDRPRYYEEYRAELTDIAAAGMDRWHQLSHVLRLMTRTASLRVELRKARRTPR